MSFCRLVYVHLGILECGVEASATYYSGSNLIFLADRNDQADRLALISEMETLIKVGRHPNIVSLDRAGTFEGTYKNYV